MSRKVAMESACDMEDFDRRQSLGTIGFDGCRRALKAVRDHPMDPPACQPIAPPGTLHASPMHPFPGSTDPAFGTRFQRSVSTPFSPASQSSRTRSPNFQEDYISYKQICNYYRVAATAVRRAHLGT